MSTFEYVTPTWNFSYAILSYYVSFRNLASCSVRRTKCIFLCPFQVLLSLRESGIVIRHLNDVYDRHDSQNLREVLVEHDRYDGTVHVLGLTPLAAGFSLLLFGSLAAAVVFYMELRCAARATPIRHILRSINDKREDAGKSGETFVTISEHDIKRHLS